MNINHKTFYAEQISAALSKIASPIPRRDDIATILTAALQAVHPQLAVKKHLQLEKDQLMAGGFTFKLNKDSRIVTIALGKAAPAMLIGALEQLGDRYQQGVCACKHLDPASLEHPGTRFIIGNHPIPGVGSLQAGEEIRNSISGLVRDDFVLLLLSGGGSALATLPVRGVTLQEMQQLTATLLRSGASINELNIVRKHLDLIKGGGLVRLAAPAKVVTLVLSDVVGNNLEVIASGPAYPDPSTFADAKRIINGAASHGNIPARIVDYVDMGCKGKVPETLKSDEPDAARGFNTIIASNIDASAAATAKAQALGFCVKTVTNGLIGEARIAGVQITDLVKRAKDLQRPFMLVWGGETTVTVAGNGKGGRNQELALAAVREMVGMADTYLITLATDGEDGPTDAAGAVVSGKTLDRAASKGLDPDDYLVNNNAYAFFERFGDLVITGPTGTNVNDLTFVFGF
ncbi:MAG TPA: DUF4147 domain-containing protein [Anaerolineaceae bacterium]|nr:DUF4147 domain-containing protein [Anaerolineaceae bacterium]